MCKSKLQPLDPPVASQGFEILHTGPESILPRIKRKRDYECEYLQSVLCPNPKNMRDWKSAV